MSRNIMYLYLYRYEFMKVSLGFFGITRSLKYTIESINNNILDILKLNNIDYDIYLHTYYLNTYSNKRSNENVNPTDIDNAEYKLLNADYLEMDHQDTIKDKINLSLYRTHSDPWKTDYNSVDNFILGQYSKLKLTNMIEKSKIKYDYILFMRPDCLYLDKLPIDFFNLVNDNSIVIPDFHQYGTIPFNDRFCICNMNTYKIYGDIFNSLLEISKNKPLHSETIIGEKMVNNNLNIIRIKFNFARIRFNGFCVDKFK
jgi:hypothetical protein